ncbi:unnamed protein product [Closterium sp. NIES-54]
MAGITGPLTDLLHKDRNFVWGEEAEAAFQELKYFLVSPPVLRIVDPSKPFEVVTDASNFAIGAVLLQDFGNGLQPIAYGSHKLQAAERNYPIHDNEMLAIIHAFKLWRCYLVGADVTVRTDHKSLQYLRAQPNLNLRQIRYLDYMESHFTYRITYKKGANNIADALTRSTVQSAAVLIHHSNPLLTGLFTHGYTTDPFFTTGNYQQATTQKGDYDLKAGTDRIWVPAYQLLRVLLIQEVHDSNFSGHFGGVPGHEIDTSTASWTAATPRATQTTVDFVTGMPAGPSGKDAVLVIVDRLTKMAHFAPCHTTITAEETARLFISTVVRLHGIPSAIISDRDPNFTSKIWKETWAQYGTKLQFSSAYHPHMDGQTERTNQTMEQLIRTNCSDPGKTRSPCWTTTNIARQQAAPTARPVPEPTLDPSKILAHRVRLDAAGRHVDFLIRWTDRTGEDDTWFLRGASGGSCPYVIRTGDLAGQTCGRLHTQHRCISRLDDTWRAEFGDDVELPRWADLLKSRIAIFDLDFDAILSAIYAMSVSAKGDCYLCVPPDPSIAAAALGASESGTLPGTTPAQALHTFTQDSGASACFFRDSTTLTALSTPVPLQMADPSGGPVVARSSTVLPCPVVTSGSLSGLHLPSFSTNLVSTAALQDAMVTTTTPGGEVAASCLCRLLSHQTLLWHHRLGHPSLHRLRGMHSRLLVSGLPRSLPPLPPSPAPTCLPCVKGWQRAAPQSSSFPLTTAPLQTLHMDVWGPARVSGQSRERYFLLSVSSRVSGFGQDLPVPRLHSDKGGEFSSTLLRDFCCAEGILHSFTLPDSPQQNGIAERRIGLVMEVARTSMIHAVAPHFLWPFAVRYAAHQLNLWPRVSLPETSPTLRWTGEVGDASVFRVWGFVHDTSADKLPPRAIPRVFLGFVPNASGWQFYHPTSRRVFPSQDVTFDESVPFYHLFPYRFAPPPPPPLFLAPGPPPVDPLPHQGPAPSGVSQVDPLPGTAPVQVAVDSGAAQGAASGGVEPGGAESEGVETEGAELGGVETGSAEPGGVASGGGEPRGAELEGVEPGGAASEGAESGGEEPQGAASSGGSAGASPRLSPQQLREWFVWRAHLRSGASGAGGIGVPGGAGVTGGTAATGPGGARTRGTGAAGTGGVEDSGAGDPTESGAAGAVGTGAGGAGGGGAGAAWVGAVDPGAGGIGATVRPRPYFVPLLQQVLGVPSSTGLTPPLLCPPPDQSQLPLQPASPLPAPSPYTKQSGGLSERREPASRPVSLVRTARCILRSRPPPVPGTHAMALRPSSVPLRVPLPSPPESSLPAVPDPESDRARAACPTVARLLATAVTDPSFEYAATSALSVSASPPSVGGECALGTDVLEEKQEHFECLAPAVPRFASMLLAPEGDSDAPDIPTPRSYVEAITGPYSSQVKRPPGSPPAFKARYAARGFSQRQGVDYFQTFSPTLKMTTLRVLLNIAAQRDYELHSLDSSTVLLQGSLHEEIWLRRPPGFTESFPAGTQWSLRRPVYSLRQVPREWHDTLRTTLAALGFAPATTDPYLGLQITRDRAWRTITLTQSHMVHQVLQHFGFQFSSPQPTPLSTSHSLSAQPSDESVEPSDASYVDDLATLWSSQGYTFSLGSSSVSWRSTCSSSVLSYSCEAENYAGAMAAQELRWLTYLLTDLVEQPRSPPVLYVDNKAMIALCQEHRLEHRMKHIALRYFLA